MQIALIVEFELQPGAAESFDRLLRPHAEASLKTEPGCRRFEILRPIREDGTLEDDRRVLFELYADDAAYRAHIATPRLAEVRKAYEPLVRNKRAVRCAL
jgi:(4S)-4-hydroxy-5-phosphonooxypentane-2,3-dione isomerase